MQKFCFSLGRKPCPCFGWVSVNVYLNGEVPCLLLLEKAFWASR